MDVGADSRCTRLTDMVTVRAPSGFGDQIRAAARAEGIRPGSLIRTAIAERIERAGRLADAITLTSQMGQR